MNHYLYNESTGECWGPYPTRLFAERFQQVSKGTFDECVVITELQLTPAMKEWRRKRLEAA